MFKRALFAVVFLLITAAPIGVFVDNFGWHPSTKLNDWGTFGSFISGIYGTLAFFAVAYSLYLTRVQFAKQSEDVTFYKAMDSLDSCVSNIDNLVDSSGGSQPGLIHLIDFIRSENEKECALLTRRILCKYYEVISEQYWYRLFSPVVKESGTTLTTDEYIDSFREYFRQHPDFNTRWERLKCDFGGIGVESNTISHELCAIGSVLFFKAPFPEREYIFTKTLAEVDETYGEFLNRYKNTITFALDHASKSINKKLYSSYIVSKLTKYEIVVLYHLAMVSEDKHFISLLMEFEILSMVKRLECRMLIIDCPSEVNIENDINSIMSRYRKNNFLGSFRLKSIEIWQIIVKK
ncbi:hypothetical protein [Vibrio alginolyticus]|uniref:hypothetical protein n=1 Tax=Vibrio alginolyticus TaxID=663 RepID=UPI001C05F57C|nr:hypothetical protein [Vibrio alginolyticus]